MQISFDNLALAINNLKLPQVDGKAISDHLRTRAPVVSFPDYQRRPYTILTLSDRVFVIFKKKINQASVGKGTQSSVALAIDCLSLRVMVYYRLSFLKPSDIRNNVDEMEARAVLKDVKGMLHFEAVHYYKGRQNEKRGAIAEHLPQGDLLQALLGKKVSKDQKKIIFQKLVVCIQALHARNVVHRDLKLENILLDSHMHPVLCDFGYAKILPSNTHLIPNCGSVHYTAPELVLQNLTSLSNDVWSLGVVCYAIFKESLPIDGEKNTLIDLGNTQMRRIYSRLEWNDPYERAIRKMLTFDHLQRPRMQEFIITLDS